MTERNRPSLEWYRRKIFAMKDHDYLVGPLATIPTNDVQNTNKVSLAFGPFLRLQRRSSRLTVAELARKLDIDEQEVRSIEHDPQYKARPRTILGIAKFFDVPAKEVMKLAGAASANDERFAETAMRFAAHSDDVGTLSVDERELLQSFVKFLRDND